MKLDKNELSLIILGMEASSQMPVFSGLSNQDIDEIAGTVQARDVDRGEVLVQQGEVASAFFVLIEGVCKTQVTRFN